MNLKVEKTPLEGLLVMAPLNFEDARGYLAETYHQVKYRQFGVDCDFVQDNQSYSIRGVLRGLHAQLKHPRPNSSGPCRARYLMWRWMPGPSRPPLGSGMRIIFRVLT